jgi:hypothetical protein
MEASYIIPDLFEPGILEPGDGIGMTTYLDPCQDLNLTGR